MTAGARGVISAEGSADPTEQICRVDPKLMEQIRVLLGIDLFRQLTLRAVGFRVLTSTAELVDDLLPVDLHLDTPSKRPLSEPSLPELQPYVKTRGRACSGQSEPRPPVRSDAG
jgi:hypothetical protein